MSRFVVRFLAVVIGIAVSLGRPAGLCAEAAAPGGGEPKDAWSQESNGLRARLSLRRSHVSNGTGVVIVYLELQNVANVGTPLLVTVDEPSMTFRVTDTDGRELARTFGVYSGRAFGTPEVVLPFDSSIRFRISAGGKGIPSDQAALVDLGPNASWALPRDGKPYYLHAVLKIAKEKNDRSDRGTRWGGQLDLPRVLIPTKPEPVDPATIGPIIDELGGKMLGEDGRASEVAMGELSLIDDPRVIPWYVKSIKTDSYSLKFNALDRLSRFEGDEALAGLKIGMATQGEHIGNCTTSEVAEQSAINIRHAAAAALARSSHPQAEALLLSMHNDPATAVRITVIQAAAKMDSPASQGVLLLHTYDGDMGVRAEAIRLMELRDKGARE